MRIGGNGRCFPPPLLFPPSRGVFDGVDCEVEEIPEVLRIVGICDRDLESGPHELLVEDSGDLEGRERLEFPAVHAFPDDSEEGEPEECGVP